MTPLAELVQAPGPRPHRHPQDGPAHKHALHRLHALHPAHGFLLGSTGIRVQQAEDGVLCGIPESVGGEDGVAAAAGRHARRVADVLDGDLDGALDAALAPGVAVVADGVGALVEGLEADDALRGGCEFGGRKRNRVGFGGFPHSEFLTRELCVCAGSV